MTILFERRKQLGVAIVTVRPSLIKLRCEQSGVPSRPLLVQAGPAWPEHRPPVVLDTIGLPVDHLVALLAAPPQALQARAAGQKRSSQPANSIFEPVIAFADSRDWRALRLLGLCPAVRLICADDPLTLRRWLLHFPGAAPARGCSTSAVWLLEQPANLALESLLLPALAALPASSSLQDAAERCGVSASTLARMLRSTKAVLGLPPGDVSRFRPDVLATTILDRLGADSPRSDHTVREYVPAMVPC